jgi:hypothetical protein
MRVNLLPVVASLWVAILIVGCSDKPPECAAQQALTVVETVMVDGFVEVATKMYSDPHNVHEPTDVAKVRSEIPVYAKGVKVSVTSIVQNGYDAGARKFNCSAKLTITTPAGQTFSRDTNYAIQATAEGKNAFVVQVSEPAPFIDALEQDFTRSRSQFRLRS